MKFDWYRLTTPRAWTQIYPTNWEWDAILNSLLDKHDPVILDEYKCKIGSAIVWIKDFPYAYGHPRNPDLRILPSVKTRYRLCRILEKQVDAIRRAREDYEFAALRRLK